MLSFVCWSVYGGNSRCEAAIATYQKRIKENHDSTSRQMLKTTQYMSQGVSWEGSDDFKALYEAKMGKRKEAMEL